MCENVLFHDNVQTGHERIHGFHCVAPPSTFLEYEATPKTPTRIEKSKTINTSFIGTVTNDCVMMILVDSDA